MKLFPKAGFNTLAANAQQVYLEHNTTTHWPRIQRQAGDFESLHDLENLSPSVNSKSAIFVTHEVEQQHKVGKLRQKSSEEMWRRNY
jgi:hypothetical protein